MLFLYDSAGAMCVVREATVHKAAALNGFPSGLLQAKASLSTDRIFIAHASARYPMVATQWLLPSSGPLD